MYTPTLKKSENYSRQLFIALALVAITFSTIEMLSRVQPSGKTPVLMDKVIVSAPIPENLETSDDDAHHDSVSQVDKLLRFEKLQGKVLMNQFEAAEKKSLLSDLEFISQIESRLSPAAKPEAIPKQLVDRLAMIDFLEEALIWKNNPVRDEVLTSIEGVLKTTNSSQLTSDERRSAIGDKIELFALLVEAAPTRAQDLLNSAQEPKLKEIFDYAIKRLGLQKRLNSGDLQ